jgi:phosphohistidine swiveling domain-containing protein
MPTANNNPTIPEPVSAAPIAKSPNSPALNGPAWDPPGVGSWTSGADHVPTSVTPTCVEIYGPARSEGMAEMFATYGLPAAGFDAGFVHGHMYDRLRPIIGADKPSAKVPPKPVLWMATRLHPEFRRRARAMAQTFASTRRWEAELQQWHRSERDRWVADNLALQDIAVTALDDDALVDHVRVTAAHYRRGVRRHFTIKGLDSAPLGDLLAFTNDRGLSATEVSAALRGASPTSGIPDQLVALADAVGAAGVRPSSVGDIRAAGPDAHAALDTYLRHFGWRVVTGYDVDGRCLIEMPDVIVNSTLAVLDRRPTDRGAIDHDAQRALRERLPASDHGEFDERFRHAASVYGVRDENGPLLFQWPLGLFRRALVEGGRRLEAQGRLHDAHHIVELDTSEIIRLLGSDGTDPTDPGLSAEAVRKRARHRAADSMLTPPDRLGPDEPAPPTDVLPSSLARGVRAIDAFLTSMTGVRAGRRSLTGVGIGAAPYQGRAVVARSAEEALSRLEPGDVLVAVCTTPSFNAVLPIVGAVVTEEGGPLCHAAVVARELGIVAVVGALGATTLIADGDEVTVDPVSGTVAVTSS